MEIKLRTATNEDLNSLWSISFGPESNLEWMKFNGPYFNDPVQTLDEFLEGFGTFLVANPMAKLITYDEKVIGIVTAYWMDSNIKQWLEIGIIIYDDKYWSKGLGSAALNLWLREMFDLFPYLPHIGFTTWSGNKGMIRAGEKVGMTLEANIRKVRYVNGKYYDSIKFGILREELI